MHRDGLECPGVSQGAVAGIKFPKGAHNAHGLAGGLELKVLADFPEAKFSFGRDQSAPAKIVGCDEGPGIGEIAARQGGDGFFPIRRRRSGGRQAKENRAKPDRADPSRAHYSSIRCRSASCNRVGHSTKRTHAGARAFRFWNLRFVRASSPGWRKLSAPGCCSVC